MTLQQRCAVRGLTLEALAEGAGVPLPTVAKIDEGAIRVQPRTLCRLAEALGLKAEALRDELSDARRRQELRSPSGIHWR